MHIYALVDPRTDKIRYIGIAKNFKQRYKQHISSHSGNIQKEDWIQELLKKGLIPSFKILETVETEDLAFEREAYWIHYYAEQGEQLTNVFHYREKAKSEQVPETYFNGPVYRCSEEEMMQEVYIPRRPMVVHPDDYDLG